MDLEMLAEINAENKVKWDKRFIEVAQLISSWSKDPSTKVGAVITVDNKIVSTGYNGFPKGVYDSKDILNNREEKYKRVVHAEVNAIVSAKQCLKNAVLYMTHFPCERCAVTIIQAGIKEVVYPGFSDETFKQRWSAPNMLALELFNQVGIKITVVV